MCKVALLCFLLLFTDSWFMCIWSIFSPHRAINYFLSLYIVYHTYPWLCKFFFLQLIWFINIISLVIDHWIKFCNQTWNVWCFSPNCLMCHEIVCWFLHFWDFPAFLEPWEWILSLETQQRLLEMGSCISVFLWRYLIYSTLSSWLLL